MAEFDFSTFPTLTTPRLILSQTVPGDAADLFSYMSDPEIPKYDIYRPMKDISEAVSAIEQSWQAFLDKKGIAWGITLKEDHHLIGGTGLEFVNQVLGQPYYKADLWYEVARPYWRRGIATEAVRALMQFGFETLGLHRINVDTRMDNIASVRLMERLGFHHEGERRECVRNQDGSYQTWGLYGMLEDEYRWLASKT